MTKEEGGMLYTCWEGVKERKREREAGWGKKGGKGGKKRGKEGNRGVSGE